LKPSEGKKGMARRIWEIDFLRVFAICLMIVYHFAYDLNAILGVSVNFESGFWYWYSKLSAIFIFVSGISAGFSRNVLRNGIKLLVVAAGISAVTYFFLGDLFIKFGVIHFLGVSMLLYLLLRKLNVWILGGLATGIALLTSTVRQTTVNTWLLLPLGFTYPGFRSEDYFPLFPYLAVFIAGIIAYKLYYYKGRSLFKFNLESRLLEKISRNSLLIYVLHQPVLMGLLLLYKYLAP